jgi:hypothetical protein
MLVDIDMLFTRVPYKANHGEPRFLKIADIFIYVNINIPTNLHIIGGCRFGLSDIKIPSCFLEGKFLGLYGMLPTLEMRT